MSSENEGSGGAAQPQSGGSDGKSSGGSDKDSAGGGKVTPTSTNDPHAKGKKKLLYESDQNKREKRKGN